MKIPTDVSWDRVINALKKIGFVVRREGKHTSMTKGENIVIIPRHKRIKRETLRDIIKDAGLTIEGFKDLL
jgi:predicted RNA binding protein YcfA (HicA-like mRNA interferase family)